MRRVSLVVALWSATISNGDVAVPGCPSPHFPVERLTFGHGATAFARADFDGNGTTDLATVSGASMLLQIGVAELDGAILVSHSIAIGSEPSDVAVGDWDGDGDVDLAVACGGSDQVKIIRNDGPGLFVVATTLSAGDEPRSIAAGDLDGDGDTDFVTANGLAGTVGIWLNDGAGNFGRHVYLDAGPAPESIRLADVDGDGTLDVLVCNASVDSNTVSVFRGLGGGSFAPRLPVEAGPAPEGLVVTDLDGDRRPDIAVANVFGPAVSIVRNTTVPGEAPSFAPPETLGAPAGPHRLAAHDVEGDGYPELFLAAAQGEAVFRYENVVGALHAGAPAIAAEGARALLVEDMNGDERVEIIVGHPFRGPLVAHAQAPGFFADEFPVIAQANVGVLVAADVIGADQLPELVGGTHASNVMRVWRNDRGERFVLEQSVTLPVGALTAAVCDIDGDGDDDVVAGGIGGVAIVRSLGAFGLDEPTSLEVDHWVDVLAVDDIDGDGDVDLVAVGVKGLPPTVVTVLYNAGDGSFAKVGPFAVGDTIGAAACLDVNGDGWRDIVLCGQDELPVLMADGRGGFSLAAPFVVGQFAIANGAVRTDWDGDGDDELLLVGIGVSIIEPVLNGLGWLSTYLFGSGVEGRAPVVDDLDGDGFKDLLYVNAATCILSTPLYASVVRGSAAGDLQLPRRYGRAELMPHCRSTGACADFTGDGRLDVVYCGATEIWMLAGTCGPPACPGDLDRSGFVDGGDLGIMLADWGAGGAGRATADLDGNGVVDGGDLGALLAAWGACGG